MGNIKRALFQKAKSINMDEKFKVNALKVQMLREELGAHTGLGFDDSGILDEQQRMI